MRVEPYTEAHADRWDALVAASPMATFLHSRRFLSYHGTRFEDRSLTFWDKPGRLCAVMPAAADADRSVVVSHPGATYGGLVFDHRNAADHAVQLVEAARDFWRAAGHARLIYKAVPPHLHRGASQADLYALWRAGARLVRRDLWNVIDLGQARDVGASRKQTLRHAREHGITVTPDGSADAYASFFDMLTERLDERHAAKPVHSLAEMKALQERHPDQIRLWIGRNRAGDCVAGCWLFDFAPAAWHGQYGATNAQGRDDNAFDLVLETILEEATRRGVRYFSFGASTEQNGTVLNSSLFNYKASFGPGSVAQDFYELDLVKGAGG